MTASAATAIERTAGESSARAAADMERRRLKRWREEELRNLEHWRELLLEKLEAVHNLAVEAAFHSAFETIYGETSWPSGGDPEWKRALNHLGCYSTEVGKRIEALLRESQEAVGLAMKRAI